MKRKIYTQLDAYESSSDDEAPKRPRAPRALPLITVDGERFDVGAEALEFLRGIAGPVAVVALAGKYRTGKSFFLNRVLLQRRASFQVGGTVNACTKGIWLWSEPIAVDGKTVVIMDTEGLGAFSATDTHDSRIFALALLLSTYFIYNSVGTIDESAISALSLVANLSKHICVESQGVDGSDQNNTASAAELGEYFPDFLWLVRDFSLQLVDAAGAPITSQQYLEAALADQATPEPERNRVRALLRSYFPRRDCATLVRPCLDEAQLQRLDALGDRELRPEFQRQAAVLRRRILQSAAPKRALGKPIDGALLARLCESFVAAINAGAAPAIRDSWSLLADLAAHKAAAAALAFFRGSAPQLPQDPEMLEANLAQLAERALALYRAECLDDAATQPSAELRAELDAARAALLRDNLQAAERRVSALITHIEADAALDTAAPAELEARFREAHDQLRLELGASAPIAALWALCAMAPSWRCFRRTTLSTSLRLEQLAAAQADWESKLAQRDARAAALEAQLAAAAQRQRDAADAAEHAKAEAAATLDKVAAQHAAELALYKELAADAEQRAAALQAAQSSELSELDEARVQLEAARLEAADAAAALDAQRAAADALAQELEAARAAARDQQLLEQRCAQLAVELRRAEAELLGLRQGADAAAGDAQRALDRLLTENAAALSEIRRAHEQEHVALQRRLREAEAATHQQRDADAAALAESQRLTDKASGALEAAERELAAARQDKDERAAAAQRADAMLAAARDRAAADLRETHDKYRGDAQRALDERTKLLRELRELSTAAAVKEVRLETLGSRLALAQEQLEQERRRHTAQQTSLQGALQSAELKRAETAAFELKQALADAQARNLALEKQLKDQEREFAIAKMKLQLDYEKQSALQRSGAF